MEEEKKEEVRIVTEFEVINYKLDLLENKLDLILTKLEEKK